jgi:hypothetical protein
MDSLYTLMQVAEAHTADLLRQAQPEYRPVKPRRGRSEFLGRARSSLRRRRGSDFEVRAARGAVEASP